MFKLFKQWRTKRKTKHLQLLVEDAGRFGPGMAALSDAELKAAARGCREAIASGELSIDSKLPELFALVREAAARVLGLRPYDVQLLGALALYEGHIAEMATGEGKTLTAVLTTYARVISGQQVHLCTANEFLADRDARAMYELYEFLGLTVGVTSLGQPAEVKRKVYEADVVYGSHSVFAMDYLSDNLARRQEDLVQVRGLGFALVDEADSVLIDEARVPVVLLTSSPADASLYGILDSIAKELVRANDANSSGDFWVDGKTRQAVFTDSGYSRVNADLVVRGLLSSDESTHYNHEHHALLTKLGAALIARHVLHADVQYVVEEGGIVLVDELTGRINRGRTWDAGLQQAIETKEGVPLSPETTVLARITLQHYFRLYEGMGGMTGTATQEAEELLATYQTAVVEIPQNKPSVRVDLPGRIYRTQAAKLEAVVAEVEQMHASQRPVLVGTASIEQSEQLSAMLTAKGVPHEMLNAKQHAREAEVMARAGALGAVTVSTNMSGRGVDILLGGRLHEKMEALWLAAGAEAWETPELLAQREALKAEHARQADQVRALGGLHIIGMERYESRRMDRQLRGRAGRQGDPGSTCFFISLEDPLVENFAGEKLRGIFSQLDIKSGDELEAAMVRKTLDSAQRQVEGFAASARKQLMKYDEVFNAQRGVYYAHRNDVLHANPEQLAELIKQDAVTVAYRLSNDYASRVSMPDAWDFVALNAALAEFGVTETLTEAWRDKEADDIASFAVEALLAQLEHHREAQAISEEGKTDVYRYVMLTAMDYLWFHHLDEVAELRRGMDLRANAKQDPQQAFNREAFDLLQRLTAELPELRIRRLLGWTLQSETPKQ